MAPHQLRCHPHHRVKDDPRAMRTVAEALKPATACSNAARPSHLPEGITHDDPQLKTVKDWRGSHGARIGKSSRGKTRTSNCARRVEPVAKNKYRSEVLVNFGEPIRAADFLSGYSDHRKECIHALSAEMSGASRR